MKQKDERKKPKRPIDHNENSPTMKTDAEESIRRDEKRKKEEIKNSTIGGF